MAAIDISTLSVDERLQLLEEIWDSLTPEPEAFPLTPEQREELERRSKALDRERETQKYASGLTVDEVLGE